MQGFIYFMSFKVSLCTLYHAIHALSSNFKSYTLQYIEGISLRINMDVVNWAWSFLQLKFCEYPKLLWIRSWLDAKANLADLLPTNRILEHLFKKQICVLSKFSWHFAVADISKAWVIQNVDNFPIHMYNN